jgi:hypothetical protein
MASLRSALRDSNWFRSKPTPQDNTPSRRVLEKAGFQFVGLDAEQQAVYERACASVQR